MQKLEYKGYTISQADNNHIMIIKANQMVFHSNCSKSLNKEELKNQIDWFIKFKNMLDEKRGNDMELKEGMYCYNKTDRKSGIGKIICLSSNNNAVIDYKNCRKLISIGNLKASYNIIDLIEVGDYVNGHKVYEKKDNCVMVGYKCFITKFDDSEEFLYQTIYSDNIKSIVTKEQFEEMSYKVN